MIASVVLVIATILTLHETNPAPHFRLSCGTTPAAARPYHRGRAGGLCQSRAPGAKLCSCLVGGRGLAWRLRRPTSWTPSNSPPSPAPRLASAMMSRSRLIAGVEAFNGPLLIGWSAACHGALPADTRGKAQEAWTTPARSRERAAEAVRLHLARSHEFPSSSARRGYEIMAPLDADGSLEESAWHRARKLYTVRRFWAGEPAAR